MSRLLVGFRFAPHSATPLLSVRHAATVIERDGEWHESFSSDCWLARGKSAQIQYGHNSTVIGSVDVVVPGRDGWWHGDGIIDTGHLADDSAVIDRITIGAPISVGFNPIHSDDDLHLRLRRHDLCELRHIAVLLPGEIPAYQGARITRVTPMASKAKPAASIDWRERLPREYSDFGDCFDGDEPPAGVLLRGNAKVGIRWDGDGRRWVAASAA